MQINVAKSAGFCFGVKRAIDIAFKTIGAGKKAYMLGDIVHNEEVVRQLKKSGIKNIKKLTNGKDKVLLIRAHGAGIRLIDKARNSGYKIIDATCPMVKEIHKIAADMDKKGYALIVIGDKKHDEVRGIIGQLKGKAIVIDRLKNMPLAKIKKMKKAAIVVQSTQNIGNVMIIVNAVKRYIGELKFFNTICNPTRIKQEEIKKMPRENDMMLIIGSKTSANTRRLYEISKFINPRSFWIRSKKDIEEKWFKGVKSLGITAGASTPDKTIREIVNSIASLRHAAPCA